MAEETEETSSPSPPLTLSMAHVPVLLKEVLESLRSAPLLPGLVLDATFGGGGFSRGVLEHFPSSRVVALDRDPEAIRIAKTLQNGDDNTFRGRLFPFHGRFSDLTGPHFKHFVADIQHSHPDTGDHTVAPFCAALFDIGVSSFQLDTPSRGFSFQRPGSLDMRMNAEEDGALTAASVVNSFSEQQLADLFFRYGEEHRSRKIAAAIVRARAKAKISNTLDLAKIVASAFPYEPERHRIHPATKTFQALRIFVNRELEELQYGLFAAECLLKPSGILGVISFHSLEDRIVKLFLRRCSTPEAPQMEPSFELLHKSVITATEEETEKNPRARSAKLRVARRTSGSPLSESFLFAR